MRKTLTLSLALLMGALIATPLTAQICRGTASGTGKNYVALDYANGPWADKVDVNTAGIHYGRQVHWGPEIDEFTTEMFSGGLYLGGMSVQGQDVGNTSYTGAELN
jgi:hypothetical protein